MKIYLKRAIESIPHPSYFFPYLVFLLMGYGLGMSGIRHRDMVFEAPPSVIGYALVAGVVFLVGFSLFGWVKKIVSGKSVSGGKM